MNCSKIKLYVVRDLGLWLFERRALPQGNANAWYHKTSADPTDCSDVGTNFLNSYFIKLSRARNFSQNCYVVSVVQNIELVC